MTTINISGDSMATPAAALAKAKYAAKVCGYLGVDKSKCERVFDKLYANMRAAFEAIV
ncbi:MAG: hypothetical protein QXY41_05915 [Thermoproteota archaeon]